MADVTLPGALRKGFITVPDDVAGVVERAFTRLYEALSEKGPFPPPNPEHGDGPPPGLGNGPGNGNRLSMDFVGGTGNPRVAAENGDGTIFGAGTRPNALMAGTGNQTLGGGERSGHSVFSAGSASLNGGADAGVFASLQSDANPDTNVFITDFVVGTDRVDLSGSATNVSEVLSTAANAGKGVQITLGDGTKITFADVSSIDNRFSS